MIVSVIGLGYIGLPTAAILASKDIEVVGVDINEEIVTKVNSGKPHITEPDLKSLVEETIANGKLKATSKYEKADIFIISVPTPFMDNNKPDISFVKSAAEGIAPLLESGNLIIIESTCPVGITQKMIQWMSSLRKDLSFPDQEGKSINSDISLAYCPERVLPGNIVKEIVDNDRIIGGASDHCAKKANELYRIFVKGECFLTDSKTAELCKLAENSFRDLNIAFANELSIISDKAGIDVWQLIRLANKHPRVNILQPGPGVGGHCIAVDPWFIVDSFPDESRLIKTSREINKAKTTFVIDKIKQATDKSNASINNLSIACLGLSFKPDIDDLRESPAMDVVGGIQNMGFKKVYVVEPHIKKLPKQLNSDALILSDTDSAIEASQLIVILVKHKSFFNVRLELFSNKTVIDTVGLTKNHKGEASV